MSPVYGELEMEQTGRGRVCTNVSRGFKTPRYQADRGPGHASAPCAVHDARFDGRHRDHRRVACSDADRREVRSLATHAPGVRSEGALPQAA